MKIVVVVALLAAVPVAGSPLFTENAVLEVTLAGPLSSVLRERAKPREHPFKVTDGERSYEVAVRARGNSRLKLCRFPPLRLDFPASDVSGTRFGGQHKLKLVTHCRNGDRKAQNAVLNEYTAYRVFNQISDKSYRVRLLRIRYVDTEGKQKKLDEPHFGFLIESARGLADRLGGTEANVPAVRFSELDLEQVGRLNVFQFFIGNRDWSLVSDEAERSCCHNIDLLRVGKRLVAVPYDFDLALLTQANYRTGSRLQRSRRREYRGYCRTPTERVETAIDDVAKLKQAILSTLEEVPAFGEKALQRRLEFAADYFRSAEDKARLLARFAKRCV
jgi:hypothetical protein